MLCVNVPEQRLAENEALFRVANEKLAELGRALAASDEELTPFLCECAELRCTKVIKLTFAEWEAVRAHPHRFAVVPGHEHADERVVDQKARYGVVEKMKTLRNRERNG
jgi:hypothetical protein